jgi:hypothetical protein
MSIARHHAEWLSLVEVSGPFLSLPVLLRAFPQGLPARDPELSKETKLMFADWLDGQKDRAIHIGWCNFVLRSVLRFPPEVVAEGQTVPPGMEAHMSEFGEVLRPSLAILSPKGAASPKPRLLVQIVASGQDLEKPLKEKHWKASPATRMTELLHAADVPLGLVTNGEHWMLVHAPRGETSGFASWYGPLWFEEPLTFQAFQALLSVERFFGVPDDQTIEALLNESAKDQQQVTDQLGWQVRKAVEVLIQSLDKIDQNHDRMLLVGVGEKQLYEAALTIMMRLVFLMCAEERKVLFPSDCQDYQDFYAISTLREQLQEVADKHVEEVLDTRFDAWGRLLATFRAVYGGVQHEAMRLPPYGGTLFDPDRFPFLEGRKLGTHWRTTPAEPLKVSNRTVLHLLNALQILQVKVPGGGAAEARRISFRALDIEQIGHVYEGLLDHTARRAVEPVLGLKAGKNGETEIALSLLEALRVKNVDELVKFLKAETGRDDRALKRAITDEELIDDQHLLIACNNDRDLCRRLRPYMALLREDTLGYPVVINAGSIYVAKGSDRRRTGTHYTPRSLTEPIVQNTLEPLVYVGPSEGKSKPKWKLKSPREILTLKVCDMTMGSGAFLVQTCRYLAERLVEAWENAEKANPGKILSTPEGDFSAGDPRERIIPSDPTERLAIARRYVADRCLYGVDINPMAVEMAKLSLWLITLQRDRPFTFLDHALKSGDSLLGVGAVEQIENFSLRSGERQVTFATANLFRYVEEASTKRRALEDLPSNDYSQIEIKNRLHSEAEAAIAKVKALADCLIAFELNDLDGEAYEEQRAMAADHAEVAMRRSLAEFQAYARELLHGRSTFHWPVEFPEAFARGGFEAVIGNPPFMGGTLATDAFGANYMSLLQRINQPWHGKADYVVGFFKRAASIMLKAGKMSLVSTASLLRGESLDSGLRDLMRRGDKIYAARSSYKWPGTAQLEVVNVSLTNGWGGEYRLDGEIVEGITEELTPGVPDGRVPFELSSRRLEGFLGVKLCPANREISFDKYQSALQDAPELANFYAPALGGDELYELLDVAFARHSISPDKLTSFLKRGGVLSQRGGITIGQPETYSHSAPACALNELLLDAQLAFACGETSTILRFAAVPTKDCILKHKLVVFPSGSWAPFALLQSEFHVLWCWRWGLRRKRDLVYSPKRCALTFPLPQVLSTQYDVSSNRLAEVGFRYHQCRRELMLSRQEGLTKTCNRLHDPGENSEDIAGLRAIQVNMDQSVAVAYGWSDLDLDHGFHATKEGVRFTLSEAGRRIVLDRLLTLNHQHYEEEVKAGLHEEGAKITRKARRAEAKPTIERLLPTGFRFSVSDPAIYAVNLAVALLSEAGGSLPWQHLRDGFVFATRPDLMQQYAASEDTQRVAAWVQRWNEKAVPKLLPTVLKALFPKNLLIRQHAGDFVFQLPEGPKQASSEDVGYDAWLALRVATHLNGQIAPLPESSAWIEVIRELLAA